MKNWFDLKNVINGTDKFYFFMPFRKNKNGRLLVLNYEQIIKQIEEAKIQSK